MDWKLLNNIIKDGDSFLLSTHVNPDGDGLGSELAFYYYLKSLGKDCKIVNCSTLPLHYKFLDPDTVIESYDESLHADWIKKVDVAVIFDIGHSIRVGKLAKYIFEKKISISIDHHPIKKNEPFTY